MTLSKALLVLVVVGHVAACAPEAFREGAGNSNLALKINFDLAKMAEKNVFPSRAMPVIDKYLESNKNATADDLRRLRIPSETGEVRLQDIAEVTTDRSGGREGSYK